MEHRNHRDKQEYALVTGASGGIGLEIAGALAGRGYGIIMVSANADRLAAAKARLEARHPGAPVTAIAQDLSLPGAAQTLHEKAKALGAPVAVLVNNAGFGITGKAADTPLAADEGMLAVNVTALVGLSKLFLADMAARRRGHILNVASKGAYQPGPYTAAYFASKAFVLSYTRALRYEAKEAGVRVSALCPGAVDTGFFEREGQPVPKDALPARRVAEKAVDGLMQGREVICVPWTNRLLPLVPEKLRMRVVAGMKRP